MDHALSIFLGDNFLNPLSIEIDLSISSRATSHHILTGHSDQTNCGGNVDVGQTLVIIRIVNHQAASQAATRGGEERSLDQHALSLSSLSSVMQFL